MDTLEINKVLKGRLGHKVHYIGVFTSDSLPHISFNSKPIVYIVNSLSSKADIRRVGHWVAFYISFYPEKKVIFYDSYGLPPEFYSPHFSKFIHNQYSSFSIYEFGIQLQPNSSHKCGLYVLQFIHFVSHHGLDMFVNYYQNHFSQTRLNKNDVTTTQYYFKHLSFAKECSYWKNKP